MSEWVLAGRSGKVERLRDGSAYRCLLCGFTAPGPNDLTGHLVSNHPEHLGEGWQPKEELRRKIADLERRVAVLSEDRDRLLLEVERLMEHMRKKGIS